MFFFSLCDCSPLLFCCGLLAGLTQRGFLYTGREQTRHVTHHTSHVTRHTSHVKRVSRQHNLPSLRLPVRPMRCTRLVTDDTARRHTTRFSQTASNHVMTQRDTVTNHGGQYPRRTAQSDPLRPHPILDRRVES